MYFFLKKIISFFKEFFKRKESNSFKVIFYIPKKSSGWILEYLFKDIIKASSNKKVKYVFCKNTFSVIAHILYGEYRIICLHQNFVKFLWRIGINLKKVSVYYTHTRVGNTNIKLLRKVNNIFILNSFEKTNLILSGVKKEKIHLFFNGYDEKLFYKDNVIRDIDFLFVCKYVDKKKENYYWNRKNISLLIKLAEELTLKGYKVLVIGKDWNIYHKKHNFNLVSIKHEEYPNIYRRSKIYISTALQEGGPVSWIEAMACGCYVLSHPTGFAAQIRDGELDSWTLPLECGYNNWLSTCLELRENFKDLNEINYKKRINYLVKFRFSYLAKTLEDKVI